MSVLIKVLSMPEKCGDCALYQDSYPAHCKAVTDFFRGVNTPYKPPRPDWCPLGEVKTPHGRLFDETEVKKCLQELTDCEDKWSAIALLEWAIEKRWCIEAEENK